MLTGSKIRSKFLDFFVQKGHKEVHSSSLVPANDPTLLFTNAGMNQFKDVFLGIEKRDYLRATTSQKCVRAGGKHNDLENVGFTNRHHTFFEMLGNFSFGDYYKEEAISFAWELLTSSQWFNIPVNKLYVTIFGGAEMGPGNIIGDDFLARRSWETVGVPTDRIIPFSGEKGLKENFWQMGDTGPCGPCSEIYYDMGVAASDQAHADCAFPCDCGRYVEIWNLVFMQFNRVGIGERYLDSQDNAWKYPGYRLDPLPKRSVDTGMGLERVAAVLQDVISNYDTDLFTRLIERAKELTGVSEVYPYRTTSQGEASLRIIADHSRAATFLIADGVSPSRDSRGYVLRKILRRGFWHARLLGATYPIFGEMAVAVCAVMGGAYPELDEQIQNVKEVIQREEERFGRTLEEVLPVLNEYLAPLQKEQRKQEALAELTATSTGDQIKFPGDKAFKLYDTFGAPLDFIQDAIRDAGMAFDQAGFDRAMEEQKSRARASWKGAAKQTANPAYQQLPKSIFEGYRQTRSDGCEVLAIIHNGQGARELKAGESGEVILDHTPFYAESGGQVGDRGWFYSDDHNTVVADVTGCYSPIQGVRAHQVVAKQALRVGDRVDAVVNADVRQSTMRNHTATHLLHAGLREVLGKHVKQAGSLVAPNHLRFDFSHFTAVEDEELQDIEDIINKEVLRNQIVETITDVPIDEAISQYHAMALFGEKYGDKVRVVRIGDFSTELCGGTHTGATGEIGLIKILKEGSVSSGVRRVEAVTGEGSLRHFRQDHELETIVSKFASPTLAQKTRKDGAPSLDVDPASPAEVLQAELEKKDSEIKRLTRELDQVRMKSASSSTANIGDQIKDVKGVKVLAHRVDNLERAQLRTLVDQLREKIGSGVVVLGSASNGNVSLIVGVTKDLTGRVQAGKVIGPVAQKVGGKGGGRPDLAEAGGKDAGALDSALAGVYTVVESLLGT
jgi:alanyl-tRNA synthetase